MLPSMDRVAVVPMKSPSNRKAAMLTKGMAITQGRKRAAASTTVVSFVSSRRKAVPPAA